MDNTEKLGLKLPASTDFYKIEDFNENFQKIDDFAKRTDNPHNVTAKQVGAVALNDDIVVGKYESQTIDGGIRFGIRYTEHGIPMVGMGTQKGTNSLIIASGCNYTNSTKEAEIGQKGYYFPITIDETHKSIPVALKVSDEDGKVYVVKSSAAKKHYTKNEIIPMSEHEVLHTGNVTSLFPFAKIANGSYVGTGESPTAENPIRLTFEFPPKIIFINGEFTIPYGVTVASRRTAGGENEGMRLVWGGNTVSFFKHTNYPFYLNSKDNTYYYAAIG